MKEMRGNIKGIAKEYVEEMFKNKNSCSKIYGIRNI